MRRFFLDPRDRGASDETRVLVEIRDLLVDIVLLLRPHQAITATLSTERIGTHAMADAVLTFKDPSGTPIAPPAGDGSGLTVAFSSDNPAVTLGSPAQGTDPTTGVPTVTAPIIGTEAFNLSAVVGNTSGAPLLDNDGVTPFVQPSPDAVAATTPVDQAVTATLSTD